MRLFVEAMQSAELCSRLCELDEKFLKTDNDRRGGIFLSACSSCLRRIREQADSASPPYTWLSPIESVIGRVPPVWRDADEIAADLQVWLSNRQRAPQETQA